ncbi:flavin-containing monooxygenase [Nocardioides bruguierae]|uniref:NAD(P)/FAD-dependent oxidoreductase n=1 Tax=Nocardioides bruguierae TaxID=2945102 RepID=A0A9X2IFM3_9ACTN|nr:NAD(P)/FAD-dependent oxidoreductase [Nocardioides bruguierae]MCM0621472.1 NAD(P)/FAD-dependent oxidoreductase [Nocardioides bruguierae]
MSDRVRLAVVGAGIAGLGLATRLVREGLVQGPDDLALLERADEVGGVWRDHVYPGVACDIPSRLYSYSFRPGSWSGAFAGGAEIHDYLVRTADEEGLRPHLRTGTALTGADWQGDHWLLTLAGPHGPETLAAEALVLAAGRLTQPRLPDVPGLAGFTGRVFHSSAWDTRPLAGLRVGVVGSGASAVQLLPHVADEAASTVLLQRTPPWVLPAPDPDTAAPDALDRAGLSARADELFEARLAGSDAAAALRRTALAHLEAQVPAGVLREACTPDYEIGCKRALFSDDWYPTLQREDVTVAPALAGVEGCTLVAADGTRHEVDVLVLATGYATTRQPYAPLVRGRDGVSLDEHWSAGMTSHASTVVHGFPNLFVLNGPNGTLGHHSAFEVVEAQAELVLGALRTLRDGAGALDVRAEAETAYTDLVDTLAARTVWTQGGCRSWYLDERSGRLTLVWPERAAEFRRRNGHFDPSAFVRVPTASTRGQVECVTPSS